MMRGWPAALVGLCGLTLALLLPFAPVFADETTLTWPRVGDPVTSTTATVVPYRPAQLIATLPCQALRASTPVTVLATSSADGDGLIIDAGPDGAVLRAGDTRLSLETGDGVPGCHTTVSAGPHGLAVTAPDGQVTVAADAPVPTLFGFRTDLTSAQAAGIQVSATVVTPFGTSPTPAKVVLIVAQLAAVATSLALLPRMRRRPVRLRWRRTHWIDVAVIAAFGAWAVIGPLAVDDGWASVIARNVATTGDPGNYFRWWNAAEVPFSSSQQLLAPFTQITLAPLWLRLPSTLLAIGTWFVMTRGVLTLHSAGVRAMAALFLLLTWLPFNLGTRPESYVAFGVTTVLAILWRSRSPAGIGWAVLIAGLTVTISPTGLLVLAPFLVLAPRIVAILRRHPLRDRVICLLLFAAIGSVCFTVMFADQTWAALLTATDWHNYFGPSLPWWLELDRYDYLLSNDQQGSFAKRLPVLMVLILMAVVLASRKRSVAPRLAAVALVGLALLALSPSKWSYHLGALAGVFAAFLVMAVLQRRTAVWSVIAGALLSGVVLVSFAGPNAWWVPAVYDVPWPEQSVWIGAGVVGASLVLAGWSRRAWPAVLTVTAAATAVALLFGTFAAAPLRRPEGSLALMNIHRVTGGPVCGLEDSIEVLPDGPQLSPAGGVASSDGFDEFSGFVPAAPPPDPPGQGASTFLWGSRTIQKTGTLVTQWFSLPPDTGMAVLVSGRTSDGNSLSFEFADGGALLGAVTPVDRVAPDEDPEHPLWRPIGVDPDQVPPSADRVRLRATDGRTDNEGWLAVTGPRQRSVVPLNAFLAEHQPVLIGWPVSFLFPCIRDIPAVSDGVAQTPGAMIRGPRPQFDLERDPVLGGTFAELDQFGRLGEVPTRLVGHPDVDWGSLLISRDDAAKDNYTREVRRVVRTGWDDTGHVAPER
jgi:arabinosyltransferase B